MSRRSIRYGLLVAGALMVAGTVLPVRPAQAQVSLNFSYGSPGYNVGYWAPPPRYRRYYSRSLYAQYTMWYYYPNLYYRYYPSPPPPPPPGIPRPLPPPYGAPLPPPPPQYFAGLRVGRPDYYRDAPHYRPGGPVPHWRPAFQPPRYQRGREHAPDRAYRGPDRRDYGHQGYRRGGPDRGGPYRGGPDNRGPGHGGPDHGGPDHGGPDHGGVGDGGPHH